MNFLKKLCNSHRLWATLFWLNALCLATALTILAGLINAAACLVCIVQFNRCKPK